MALARPEAGTFTAVLAELGHEHRQAVDLHGFDESHDDAHGDQDWAWMILRRVSELMAPQTVLPSTTASRRRAFLEVAHIAASAVAASDRRTIDNGGILEVPAELGGATLDASGIDPPPIVTSVDNLWRYVARPNGPLERHTLMCHQWQPGPGITCTGACAAHLPTEDPDA